MNILNGKPVKAFLSQDHASHLAVHMSMVQDPLLAAQMGQNPQAQKIIAAEWAHVAEHVGFQYRVQLEQISGQKFPPPNEPIPPELEVQLSRAMAQAAQQLLAQDKQHAAQQQALQAAQDPVVQAQKQDLDIKQAEVDRKKAKDVADEQLEKRRLDIMEAQINSQQENSALQTLTMGITQKHAADTQAQTQQQRLEADAERARVQGAHTIANTVIGHLVAGQKNAGPRTGGSEE
jgi:hypothetical protein